jgi:hypothetical protein
MAFLCFFIILSVTVDCVSHAKEARVHAASNLPSNDVDWHPPLPPSYDKRKRMQAARSHSTSSSWVRHLTFIKLYLSVGVVW